MKHTDIDFNQEYSLLDKKYRGESRSSTKVREYNLADAIHEAQEAQLITSAKGTFSLGGGKEAFVILGENDGEAVCVKTFKPYSATNEKRTKSQFHVTSHEMAAIMAKTEFWNLRIFDYYKVNVPKPLEHNGGLAFSMSLIRDKDQPSYEPAPLLKHVDLENNYGIDPGTFLESILDQIELMFKTATMVHGDLSEFNILVANEKPWIIDVSQSRLYNNKTFADTPVRIRIDSAIRVLERDVKVVLEHFERKYRIGFPYDDVFNKLVDSIPSFAKRYCVLEERKMIKKRMPRYIEVRPGKKVDFWDNAKNKGWF
ncbi:MAG: RIO1 family regulatory kinase/ATPase domain-containing protein [Candidatus Hodarchaeales archaeon]|jgi:RIO kinase 1